MATLEEHCRECEQKLGKPWREVHLWLDELFKLKGIRHRRYRHNLGGIDYVRERWGTEAAQAARLHIITDLSNDGWQEADGIPKDSQDYVIRGLS
jgi:hypothetical protein